MNNPHIGFGALLQKGDGASPQNFVTIMGITSITGPGMSRDTIDVTSMDSTQFREFIGGLIDAGEISFEANLLISNNTQNQEEGGFLAEFDKTSCDSRGQWRLVFPECNGASEGYLEFDGIVSGYSVTIPLDDKMTFTGTVKVSGRPNLVLYDTAA